MDEASGSMRDMHQRRARRRGLIVAGALCGLVRSLAACSSEDAAVASVRDSAGIRIIETSVANDALPQWALDSVPRVTIGVLEGDSTYQLDRVYDALFHGNRIIVANGGGRELRVFDREGQYVATGGRHGEGPGEFESIAWMAPFTADSIVVFDSEHRRFSIFDLAGRFGRSFQASEDFFDIAGRFADGSLLLPPVVSFGAGDESRNGLVRDSSHLVRVSAAGDQPDTLMVIIGPEIILQVTPRSMSARMAPFGRVTRVAVGDTVFHTTTSDSYEIRSWNREGRLVRVLRRTIDPVPVTAADVGRYKAGQLARARSDNQRRELERTLAETPYPDRMPALGHVRVDDDGSLWVQDFSPWTDEPTHWTVFDDDGRPIGRVHLPARFTLHQIGSDFVLGTSAGELDVQQVVVYGLTRASSLAVATRGGPQ